MAAAAEDEYARVIRAQVKHVLSETHLKCDASSAFACACAYLVQGRETQAGQGEGHL